MAPPRLPGGEAFADPHYSHRLTQQTSDDLQFIARFIKVMMIVWLVMLIPAVVFFLMSIGTVLAAFGGLLRR